MDGFIDRFAQRKNAQDIIRANAEAEAQENARLHGELAGYENAIVEIQKSNQLNIENAEKVREVLEEGLKKIAEVQKIETPDQSEELMKICEELKAELSEKLGTSFEDRLSAQKEEISKLMKDSEDFVHKENVKVYRNVQAVIQEELPKQTEEIKSAVQESVDSVHTSGALLPLVILALLASLGSIALQVLQILHII